MLEACDESAADGPFNDFGRDFRRHLGDSIFNFLTELHRQEQKFNRGRKTPFEWISPKRCRCWVRANATNGPDDCPVFALALQVRLDEDSAVEEGENKFRYRNLLRVGGKEGKDFTIGMKPFPRQLEAQQNGNAERTKRQEERGKSNSAKNKPHTRMPVSVGAFRDFDVEVYMNNPHLSFLLSRISAYRFSFMQRPGVLGQDVMADVLHKNPCLPWFVVPLMAPDAEEWKADDRTVAEQEAKKENAKRSDPPLQRRLVGYLTFDNGHYKPNEDEPLNETITGGGQEGQAARRDQDVERPEDWIAFQNSLLDEMDLFAAALVMKPCLRSLVPERTFPTD
jgi:hypothetical protein